MKIKNLFDKNHNIAILLAGILTIVVSIGVARFAFTSLLASMLADTLSISNAGILASMNFFGYLSGAIFVIFIQDINAKVRYFRIAIVLNLLSTMILATTDGGAIWMFSRLIAGFSSGLLFLIGSALVMVKLDAKNKTKIMGIYFTGLGFAIIISELVTQMILAVGSWVDVWLVLALLSFVLSFYIVPILSFDTAISQNAPKHKLSTEIFTPYVILLILAYFTEGVGFVIQATFLPDIINSLDGLKGQGNLVWLIVGIAGVPSSIIWMRLAHRYGSIHIIIAAMLLQIVGILIPAFSHNIYLNLLSGALYGSTFIGLVALFINRAGELAKANPVVLMGSMTAAYGIGQVIAPLYSIALIEHFGDYNSSLYLTAAIVATGVILLLLASKIPQKRVK